MTEEERGEGREGRLCSSWTVRRDRQNMFTTMLTTLSPSQPHLTGEIIQLSTKCDFDRHFSERGERKVLVLTCNLDWWCWGEEAEETLKTYLTYDKCHKLNFLRRDEH